MMSRIGSRHCGDIFERIISSWKPTLKVTSPSRHLSSILTWSRPTTYKTAQVTSTGFHTVNLCTSIVCCHQYTTSSKQKRSCIIEQNGETYIRSPYPDAQIPDVPFTEFVFSYLDKYQDLELVVDDPTGRRYTGSQLKENTIRVASALHKLGYRKGDVVLVFAANCPEYILLFLACGLLGCPVSTANQLYTSGELARQLSHCEAKYVVTTTNLLPTVTAAIVTCEDGGQRVKEIITIDGPADKCRPFQTLLDDDDRTLPENVDISPKRDTLAIPYSSGTTGLPKGVIISHYEMVANLCQAMQGQVRFRTGEEILLGLMPFFHIYGIMMMMAIPLVRGVKLVIVPKFEPQPFLHAIQKHKMTYIHIVPPIALFLAKHPMIDDFDLSAVKTVLCGAAPLGAAIEREMGNRLNTNCLQAYGSTELMLLMYGEVPSKLGTVGQVLPSIVAKVIDPETGKILPQGMEGELAFTGPHVVMEYLKNKEATYACMKDGWGYTGDIGCVDEEGYFIITDRLKELIKYKAFQVAPAELEALLCTHNAIQDAAVIGIKAGEDVGEIPKAFVVAKPGVNVTEEEIAKFVEKNVAEYKRLRGGVEFVSEIPKSPSGKILRRMLRS